MTDTMRAARARLVRPLPRSGPVIDLLRAAARQEHEALPDAIRHGAGPLPTHVMDRGGRVLTMAEYRAPHDL